MRRYRKGQMFRPPTAAESAANADAAEGFRRRAPVSQDKPPRGGDIVKTPAGGIDGRDGTTIFSATCTRCVETSIAGEKTILETDEEIPVYNLNTTAVAGGIYVKVGITLGGTLCVDQGGGAGHAVIRFEILSAGPFLGDQGTPECDSVVAEVLSISCAGADVEVGEEVIIWDPSRCNFNVPLEVLIGSHGWATEMINDTEEVIDCAYERLAEGACFWVVQTLCCVEDIYA